VITVKIGGDDSKMWVVRGNQAYHDLRAEQLLCLWMPKIHATLLGGTSGDFERPHKIGKLSQVHCITFLIKALKVSRSLVVSSFVVRSQTGESEFAGLIPTRTGVE